MEFRDDLLLDWDDCAVDSKFFDAVLRQSCDETNDVFLEPHCPEDSSCSSAPSFASSGASEACSSSQDDLTGLEAHEDQGAVILAGDPLLRTFLESGHHGVSRCFFFRSPDSPFLVVAQSLAAVANGRRFYDNLNMLEGLGLLRRGPVSCLEGARYRLFTWFGNAFMRDDFRRMQRHGQRSGLEAAVRAVEAGRKPVPDRFTTAVPLGRQEQGLVPADRRKSRGKCPLGLCAQRVLVILLSASRPLNLEAIIVLLQAPFPDVNLQRRYFYIRDVLVNFGLARVVKPGCFEYCGPALYDAPTQQPNVVPLFMLKENVLTPLRIDTPLQNDEPLQINASLRMDAPLQINTSGRIDEPLRINNTSGRIDTPLRIGTPLRINTPLRIGTPLRMSTSGRINTPLRISNSGRINTPGPSSPHGPPAKKSAFCVADFPTSLSDAQDMLENLPPCIEEGGGEEEEEDDVVEDLLMRSCSNASSVLRRTDTLLPWTNSS